jgi:hypothetical protein
LTAKKFLLEFPKFEVGHIPSQTRCAPRGGFSIQGSRMICTPPSQSVADRVKILISPFPDDDHLKAWAARMVAAADEFRRNKRPDPLGGFVFEIARSFPGALCGSVRFLFLVRRPEPDRAVPPLVLHG